MSPGSASWGRVPLPGLLIIRSSCRCPSPRADPWRGGAHAHPHRARRLIVARLPARPLVVYSHGGDVRGWRSLPGPSAGWPAGSRDGRTGGHQLGGHRGYLRELGGQPGGRSRPASISRGSCRRRGLRNGACSTSAAGTLARDTRSPAVSRTRWSARGSATSIPPRSRPSLPRTTSCSFRRSPSRSASSRSRRCQRPMGRGQRRGRAARHRPRRGQRHARGRRRLRGALARVPDYDPARSPRRSSATASRMAEAMARIWDEVAPRWLTVGVAAAATVVMLVRNAYTHDTRVEKEARTLVGAGHRVSIVADAGPGLPDHENRDGEPSSACARHGPAVPGLALPGPRVAPRAPARALRPRSFTRTTSNALVPVAFAAAELRIPYVYDAHELWLGRPRRERRRLYFALSQASTGRRALLVPRAAAVLTVSPPIAGHLRRRYRLRASISCRTTRTDAARLERREMRDLAGGEAIDPGCRSSCTSAGSCAAAASRGWSRRWGCSRGPAREPRGGRAARAVCGRRRLRSARASRSCRRFRASWSTRTPPRRPSA